MMSVIRPLFSMRMNALGANTSPFVSAAAAAEGTQKPTTNAPPRAKAPSRKTRRVTVGSTPERLRAPVVIDLPSSRLCGFLDCLANAHIRAAPTDVAGHRRINVGITRMGRCAQERARGHDLPGLTVAALYDLHVEPGPLDARPGGSRSDTFNGGDRTLADRANGQDARSHGVTVHMHGAGTALCDSTSELGARQAEHIPQHPQERHVGGHIDALEIAVDSQIHG